MLAVQARSHYALFATLLDYPSANYPTLVEAAAAGLEEDYPEPAARLRAFGKILPPSEGTLDEVALDEVQEIFTRSFDVQAITTLGVGYVVFGDDYKRGELLVNLNRELRALDIDTGTELSDHLPTILRLMARWEDEENSQELADQILHPALARMIGEFSPKQTEHRNHLYKKHYKTLIDASVERGTIFAEPLKALLAVLKQDFELGELQRPEVTSTFLQSVVREMEIEAEGGKKQAKRNNRRSKREPRRLV